MLVEGEAGVGKSLVARLLHLTSLNPRGALVVLAASDPPGGDHPWATPISHEDMVVLDGLERWPKARQTELLRRIARPGGPLLVGLSRLSLSRLRKEGRLLPSLALRFESRHATVAPLRARPDDIGPIVETMLRRVKRSEVILEPEAWRALATHGWPGNVRELRQVVDRALVRVRGDRIGVADLALDPLAPPSLEVLGDTTFDAMREAVDGWFLRRAIHHADGNLSEAARRIGSSRKVLRERLRRLGLYPPAGWLEESTSAEEGRVIRFGRSVGQPGAQPIDRRSYASAVRAEEGLVQRRFAADARHRVEGGGAVEVDVGQAGRQLRCLASEVGAREDRHPRVLEQALAQLRAGGDASRGQGLGVRLEAGEQVERARGLAAA